MSACGVSALVRAVRRELWTGEREAISPLSGLGYSLSALSEPADDQHSRLLGQWDRALGGFTPWRGRGRKPERHLALLVALLTLSSR